MNIYIYIIMRIMLVWRYWPQGQSSGRTLVGGPGFGAPSYDGPGELQFPAGLAIDELRGYMYVADTGHHRVVRYSLNDEMQVVGAGLTVAGADQVAGKNLSLLDNPTALALSGDRLYVADARNNRVMTWLIRPELLETPTVRQLLRHRDIFYLKSIYYHTLPIMQCFFLEEMWEQVLAHVGPHHSTPGSHDLLGSCKLMAISHALSMAGAWPPSMRPAPAPALP